MDKEIGKIKRKGKTPLPPPSWAESSPRPRPLPRLTPATPSPSAHLPAHSVLAPAHTDTSSPLVSHLPLALARDRFRWQDGPTGQPLRRPRRVRLQRGHLRPPSSPSLRPLAAQERLAPPRPRRSDRVLARHRPPCGLIVAVVRHLLQRCAPHRRPPSSTAPLPSGAYKRAAPSTSLPRTGLNHLSSPSPELSRESATVFFPSGKPSSFPSPSGCSARNWIGLSASPHRRELGTPLPCPNPRTHLTGGNSRRGAPPPPRGQPPPGPL
jgi:hypothetical protein